jgi:hypothetical protein
MTATKIAEKEIRPNAAARGMADITGELGEFQTKTKLQLLREKPPAQHKSI